MAWTAPKTWSASEVVLASGTGSLNEQVRDNFLNLSTHTHSGAAGMGAASLATVTFTGLNTVTFADQSGNPSTNGRLQRNGTELLYYDGTTAQNLTAADQAAGTASLRTLGTNATQAAAGNHTHDVDFTSNGTQSQVSSNTDGWTYDTEQTKAVGSISWTPTGATSRAVWIGSSTIGYAGSSIGSNNNSTFIFKSGSTVLKTVTGVANSNTSNEGVIYQTTGTSAVTLSVDMTWTSTVSFPVVYTKYRMIVAETTGSV